MGAATPKGHKPVTTTKVKAKRETDRKASKSQEICSARHGTQSIGSYKSPVAKALPRWGFVWKLGVVEAAGYGAALKKQQYFRAENQDKHLTK